MTGKILNNSKVIMVEKTNKVLFQCFIKGLRSVHNTVQIRIEWYILKVYVFIVVACPSCPSYDIIFTLVAIFLSVRLALPSRQRYPLEQHLKYLIENGKGYDWKSDGGEAFPSIDLWVAC